MSLVGVPELPRNLDVSVYPNPTASHFYVDFSQEDWGEVSLEVSSLQGQVLHRWTGQPGFDPVHMDLGPYANGVYLLSVRQAGQPTSQNFRIVKIDF